MLPKTGKFAFLLLACTMLALISQPAFSQDEQNFYIGLNCGTGNTFTKVDWTDPNNKFNYLKGRYGPSFFLGINLRYDLKEKLSFQTGAIIVNRDYRATYSSKISESYSGGFYLDFPSSRFGFSENRVGDIIIPLLCIGRIPFNRDKRLYASFFGGPALDLMINPNSWSKGASFNYEFSFSNQDSASSAFYVFEHPRKGLQPMLVLGVGMEKKTKKRCIIGFSLVSYIGFQKVYTGEFYFYDTPIYAPEANTNFSPEIELPPQPPAEHDKIFSRNTSLMLRFDFFFATKKWN